MVRAFRFAGLAVMGLLIGSDGFAQDSAGAASSRKRIQQKVTIEAKDIRTQSIFQDIEGEMEKPVKFKIDTGSGMSLNTKLTYSAKNKTVEQILNEMADKFEFGWFVKSDPKDRYDGWIIIRKAKEKERGYEGGKDPKSKATLPMNPSDRRVLSRVFIIEPTEANAKPQAADKNATCFLAAIR